MRAAVRTCRRARRLRPPGMGAALAAVWLAVGAAAPGTAQQIGAQPVGEVLEATGDVTQKPPGETSFQELLKGAGVLLDSRVRTGDDSYLLLLIEDDDQQSLFDLDENSEQLIDQQFVEGLRVPRIELIKGRLTGFFRGFFRGTVETTAAVLGIKGTIVRVEVDAGGLTTVDVLEGLAEVTSTAGGPAVLVPAGYRTLVRLGSAPTLPAPSNIASGTLYPVPDEPFDSPLTPSLPIDRGPG